MEPEHQSDGPPDSVRAAADALRTRRHAEVMFDIAAAHLGDAAWHESANGGRIRRLFRRDHLDPTQIVPWPVVELCIGDRFGVVGDWMPVGDAPVDVPSPRPADPPKLRGIGPGEVRLLDGDECIEIVYNDDGAKLETCRSHHPHPLAGLVAATVAKDGNPTELLGRFIAGLNQGRHGPGRVHMPAAMPHGAEGVWMRALRALRCALFEAGVVRGAKWAVADGLTGTALAFGATREEALSRWHEAVAARSPWPTPKPEPEILPDVPPGAMVIRGPEADVPLPDAVPENVPAAIVPLGPPPTELPKFGSWTALLGARGASWFAACRRKREGFTLIGQKVHGAVDFDRLDAQMDRIDGIHEEQFRAIIAMTPGGVERRPCRTTRYRVRDEGRLTFDSSSECSDWGADELDGDVIAQRVVRQCWVK